MSNLVRFGVSLDNDLLKKFDARIKEKKYTNRSEAIRDLIRDDLVKKEWQEGKEVTGSITIVYNHHKRELTNLLIDIQHDYHDTILSTQHIHLDHDNCLEIIVIKGKPKEIEELYGKLKSAKGVKHGGLSTTTTGKEII
ncbi:MAG: nickel-responsive transcriptional regulator NikR [Planctomycetes bacterium]|jgi:CopG family nickel-responsive transcriptional regulator|nr:nickel-responsive transcriptional regulator NikR [Planctomycetota bacterium]